MTYSRRKMECFSFLFVLAIVLSVACGSNPNEGTGTDGPGTNDGDESAVDSSSSDPFGSDAPWPDGTGDDSTSGGEDCAAVSALAEMAKIAADVVIVVDNSPTMTEEAQFVEAQVNVLAKDVVDSGVDAHVVLISAPNPGDKQGVCIAPPLGSGSCPADSLPPTYLHVDESVSSHHPLDAFLETYDQWKSMRRPGAHLSILVVSDDDSSLSAAEFTSALTLLDPPIDDMLFHAIVSGDDGELSAACDEYAASEGAVYKELVAQTGGVLGDLCLQESGEFDAVFDEIAEQISSFALPCSWTIPAPPSGQTLDPGKVNVHFEDGVGSGMDIGAVPTASDCATVEHGWYYDDPADPETIVLCPQTCEAIQSYEAASLSILFGCTTEEATPVL